MKIPEELPDDRRSEFERLEEEPSLGLLAEFWMFIREEKKWWLTPIILFLLLAGILAWASATGAAPFIYTLF
ncbi:MAG: DUF5989 family protein [Planctomycetota bacterium]